MAATIFDSSSSTSSSFMEVESQPTPLGLSGSPSLSSSTATAVNTSSATHAAIHEFYKKATAALFNNNNNNSPTNASGSGMASDDGEDMMELATFAINETVVDGQMMALASNFDEMPEELVYLIFTFLHGSDIANGVQKVCRNWRRLALDDQLWLDLLRRAQMDKSDAEKASCPVEEELRKPAHKSWRWLYQSRHLIITDPARVGATAQVGRHETPEYIYEGEWKDGKHHGHGRKIWKQNVKSESEAKEENEGAALAEGDAGAASDASAPENTGDVATLGGGQALPKRGAAPTKRRAQQLPYYEGEWKEGKEHGRGKRLFEEDHYYIGEWKEGDREGFGFYHWPNKTFYEGEFKEGFRHGHGTYTWSEKAKYIGQWQKGIEHGKGVRTWADGDRYEGDWVHGTRTGYGTYTWPNGSSYEGKWLQCAHEGYGVYKWPDGRTYKGTFSANKKHGVGEYFWPDGAMFTGQWRNGVRHGDGTMAWPDNARFHGEWTFDRRAAGRYTGTDGREVPQTIGAAWSKKYDYYFAMPMDMWEQVYLPEINRLIRERKERESSETEARRSRLECNAKGAEDSRPWGSRAGPTSRS